MLKQRVITASILATLVVLAVLVLPPFGFSIVLSLVIALGAWEWSALLGLQSCQARGLYVAGILGLLLVSALALDAAAFVNAVLGLSVLAWCAALFWLRYYARHTALRNTSWQIGLTGIVVLIAPWVALLILRNQFGAGYVLFLLLLIAAADIGAYFAGRRWGQRKLAAAISPGKTWEGVAGASAAALLFAIAGAAWFDLGVIWLLFFIVCLFIVVFSIVV